MRIRPVGVALLLVLSVCTAVWSAPLSGAARAEVDALFLRLQAPGCQFNRNGDWYTGAEAQAHLARKLEYLEGKDLVKTAEDFISLGASTSSSSGKPYWVRCGSTQPQESKAWLLEQLKVVRKGR